MAPSQDAAAHAPDAADLAAPESPPVMDIVPQPAWGLLDLGELWRYRELLWTLARRDLAVRYKQAALGVLWVILQPLVMVTILTIIVSRVGGFAGQIQTPYPLLALAGWIAWQMFARGMGDSALSLTTNVNLVTKVYFPRILLPTAPLLTSLVDFAVALALLLGMMAIYGRVPSWPVIFVPAFAAMALLASLSIGLWLAALNAVYRDVRHMLPFLTQVWLLVSPVAYPHTLVPERYRLIYALNPMVGVIGGLRWALLGEPPPHWGMLAASLAATVLLLAGGLWYFHRTEADLADVV